MTPHYRNRQDEKRNHAEGTSTIDCSTTTFFDGTDTEVRVTIFGPKGETFYGEGYAFLSPKDAYDPEIGQDIAFLRAVRDALMDAELEAISRSQTIKQAIEEEASAAYPDFWDKYPYPYEYEYPDPEWDETEAPTPTNNCVFCAATGADPTKPCPLGGNSGTDYPADRLASA